jgi:FtsP/CotA-like multicopper oxidase with cupredoxin domain
LESRRGVEAEPSFEATKQIKPTMKVVFDANNPSLWAFHRHNLFHMVAGMFATVVYDGFS